MRYFIAGPERWEQNVSDGRTATAIPAKLTHPDGQHEPGIAINVGDRPRIVIPTADAIRLAHTIADVATTQRKDTT